MTEQDGYVLTVAPSGIKFKETSGEENLCCARLVGKYRMESVVQFLRYKFGSPVPNGPSTYIIDKTGLEELYEISFMVNADGGRSGGPSEFTTPPSDIVKAVENQLGLHLEPAKVPVEVIVVDHLEPPMEN